MNQLPAKVMTVHRLVSCPRNTSYFGDGTLGNPCRAAVRLGRKKPPETGDPRVSGEFQPSLGLPGTSEVIRRFNRETEALAALVVSAVVSAALLFAVLFQDYRSKIADLTEEARGEGAYLFLNNNLRPEAASQYEQSMRINFGQATSVDHVFARLFDKQLPNRTVHAP